MKINKEQLNGYDLFLILNFAFLIEPTHLNWRLAAAELEVEHHEK